jgi:hypothetical protein
MPGERESSTEGGAPISTQRERAEEKRKEKLKAVEEQVAEGSLTIRQMTPEEKAKYPKRERPPQAKRKRY